MEQNVARQTVDLAVMAEERFERELVSLRLAAEYLEPYEVEQRKRFFQIRSKSLRKGVHIGLMRLDGQSIYGRPLSVKDFSRLYIAYRGNDVIDYHPSLGLIFIVPVYHQGNVSGLLYRLYDNSLLVDLFGLANYNEDIRLLIQERSGLTIVPNKHFSREDREFFRSANVVEGFAEVRRKLFSRRSAAVFVQNEKGRFFVFGADLPRTNCSLMGYVPWTTIVGNIARIHDQLLAVLLLVLLVFGLICIAFLVLQSRSEENEILSREKELADKSNMAKSAFLANMSHEIRTPVNAIMGMNEMIMRESDNPKLNDYAYNIKQASETLLAIINDILDFSRIESGKLEIMPKAYTVSSMLNDVAMMIAPRARQKHLYFNVRVDPLLPDGLCGDMVRIQQIIMNLLTNAVKYTREGSVRLSVSYESQGEDQIILWLVVADTGIGIQEADKARLFHGFERFDTERNRNIEGTGLGLAITNDLVKRMHGTISFESEYGVGTTFTVLLPQTVLDTRPIGNFSMHTLHQEKKEHQVVFRAPQARLLVVDDNEMNLFVVVSLLKETGIGIDTCRSGQEALNKLLNNYYDLVLLDQMMPEMDGVQTLQAAKKIAACAEIPFIVFTANATSGAREALLAEGFVEYLSKPVQGEELEKVLAKFLPRDKVYLNGKESERQEKADAPLGETQPVAEKPIASASEHTASPEPSKQASPESRELSEFNVELGLSYSGGDRGLYNDLLSMFCQLWPKKKEDLEAAFSKEDWPNYAILIHALKSSALSVGGEQLSDLAKKLEMAAKAQSQGEAQESLAFLHDNHAKAMLLGQSLVLKAKAYVLEQFKP
ncbi:MAG: response regulator [Desulfovibrio sp.]|nr:response regulator [Desulfovibrio sp.]